jgi:hypothetical protein
VLPLPVLAGLSGLIAVDAMISGHATLWHAEILSVV